MKVSLYIPSFNAEKYIKFCLEAALRQNYPIGEIMIIDDASTDKTAEIASKFPVKIIRHPFNKGLAAARNTALKNAKYEFIASLDADCVPDPDWLKKLVRNFTSLRIAGIGGRLLELRARQITDKWRATHMKQEWGQKKSSSISFLFGSNTVFRKKVLLGVGGYSQRYRNNYEDVDISARVKRAGYRLIYEPEALATHLKKDNICSILDLYWNWNLGYYQKHRFYSNSKKFAFKLKDNIGLANRYIEEDIRAERYGLLYLDFLLALHHSLKDLDFFAYQNNHKNLYTKDYSVLPFWLSLLDLTFFYHIHSAKKNLPTLIPKSDAYLQNFLALNLILGEIIQKKFKNAGFQKILYKHLFLSVYKINNDYLVDKLINLLRLHQEWSGLITKKQRNFNRLFLRTFYSHFPKWLDKITFRFPGIIRMIESSAEKIDRLS